MHLAAGPAHHPTGPRSVFAAGPATNGSQAGPAHPAKPSNFGAFRCNLPRVPRKIAVVSGSTMAQHLARISVSGAPWREHLAGPGCGRSRCAPILAEAGSCFLRPAHDVAGPGSVTKTFPRSGWARMNSRRQLQQRGTADPPSHVGGQRLPPHIALARAIRSKPGSLLPRITRSPGAPVDVIEFERCHLAGRVSPSRGQPSSRTA